MPSLCYPLLHSVCCAKKEAMFRYLYVKKNLAIGAVSDRFRDKLVHRSTRCSEKSLWVSFEIVMFDLQEVE